VRACEIERRTERREGEGEIGEGKGWRKKEKQQNKRNIFNEGNPRR
jgi:hypothetical protein